MQKVKITTLSVKKFRAGFSVIELIFVILIMGILASVAVMSRVDNRLYSDKNFIIQKIKEKQLYALSYDNCDFSSSWRGAEYEDTCIELDKDFINTSENSTKRAKKYQLSSQTTISSSVDKICFDTQGRVYKDNYKLNNLLVLPIELNISYKEEIKRVKIMPFSGYIVKEK
jgi:prepilin-type N-terminal cleavage/methylation domain-containing protein